MNYIKYEVARDISAQHNTQGNIMCEVSKSPTPGLAAKEYNEVLRFYDLQKSNLNFSSPPIYCSHSLPTALACDPLPS